MPVIPSPLLTLVVAIIILTVLLIIRIARDARDITAASRINRHLIVLGKRQAKTSFDIIITLHRKADSIFTLLDHLQSHQYTKINVIIIIKHTAGKNARSALQRYKKTHNLQMQLIRHKAGMTTLDVVRQYAKSTLVMSIPPDTKLSKDFFVTVSSEFSLSRADHIITKQYVRLDRTIKSALRSQRHRITSMPFPSTTPIEHYTVYRRQSLVRPRKTLMTHKSNAYVSYEFGSTQPLPSVKKTMRQAITRLVIATVVLSASVFVGTMVAAEELLLLTGLLVGGYIVSYGIEIVGNAAYPAVDKISMVLLSPLFLGQYVWHEVHGSVVSVFKTIRSH